MNLLNIVIKPTNGGDNYAKPIIVQNYPINEKAIFAIPNAARISVTCIKQIIKQIVNIIIINIIMISTQILENCFEELKTKRKLDQIWQIIENYQKIAPPELPPLQKFNQTLTSNISYNTNSFVPSPDLLKSYQETFSKANQQERIVNTTNYKLKANFSQSSQKYNSIRNQIVALPKNDQAIIIEGRQETILKQLREGQIETTIPQMENSLFNNQLSHLEHKNIIIENTLPLSEWKKLREKLNPKRSTK